MQFLSVMTLSMILAMSALPAWSMQIPKYNISLGDVIAAVERPFAFDRDGNPEITDVRADFFQRSTIAEKNREFRADGQMYLKPASAAEPLKFRFEYYRPTRQEIVCDGRTLWIYLPENRQVIRSDVAEFFEPSRFNPARNRAINFLQGLGRISKDFSIVFNRNINDQAGNYILELTPNRASATIEKLFITVNRDALGTRSNIRPQLGMPAAAMQNVRPFPILATTVIDHDGNSTIIEFSNAVTNSMTSDSLFQFDIPPGMQVVRPPTAR